MRAEINFSPNIVGFLDSLQALRQNQGRVPAVMDSNNVPITEFSVERLARCLLVPRNIVDPNFVSNNIHDASSDVLLLALLLVVIGTRTPDFWSYHFMSVGHLAHKMQAAGIDVFGDDNMLCDNLDDGSEIFCLFRYDTLDGIGVDTDDVDDETALDGIDIDDDGKAQNGTSTVTPSVVDEGVETNFLDGWKYGTTGERACEYIGSDRGRATIPGNLVATRTQLQEAFGTPHQGIRNYGGRIYGYIMSGD